MLLKELIDDTPLLSFREDNQFQGSQPFEDKPSFDAAYARPLGTFNCSEIWGSGWYGEDILTIGVLEKDRTVSAWCAFDLKKNSGYLTWIRAWVDSTKRGSNLTLTIINYMVEKRKQKVLIDKDESTSTDSHNLLRKWYSYHGMKRHFKMTLKDDDKKIDDIEVALKNWDKNNISIVFEDEYNRKLQMFGAGYRVFPETKWY